MFSDGKVAFYRREVLKMLRCKLSSFKNGTAKSKENIFMFDSQYNSCVLSLLFFFLSSPVYFQLKVCFFTDQRLFHSIPNPNKKGGRETSLELERDFSVALLLFINALKIANNSDICQKKKKRQKFPWKKEESSLTGKQLVRVLAAVRFTTSHPIYLPGPIF